MKVRDSWAQSLRRMQLWSSGDEAQLVGQWSQWGESRLSSRVFDLKLPRALASRIEIELPSGWEASVSGLTPRFGPQGSMGVRPGHSIWEDS